MNTSSGSWTYDENYADYNPCRCSVVGSSILRPGAAAEEGSSDRFLLASSAGVDSRVEAFRQRFRELGYIEGKNIAIEWRYAEGKEDRLRKLAAELVQLNATWRSRG